jgi:hypothetical protein
MRIVGSDWVGGDHTCTMARFVLGELNGTRSARVGALANRPAGGRWRSPDRRGHPARDHEKMTLPAIFAGLRH